VKHNQLKPLKKGTASEGENNSDTNQPTLNRQALKKHNILVRIRSFFIFIV